MKYELFALVLCMIAFQGCRTDTVMAPKKANSAIIPSAYFQTHRGEFSDDVTTRFWTPTWNDVHKAIKGTQRELERRKRLAFGNETQVAILETLINNLGRSRVQFVGFFGGTNQMLQMNFLPPARNGIDSFPKWRDKYIIVDDGGANFWRIEYDLKSEQYTNFVVNGEA